MLQGKADHDMDIDRNASERALPDTGRAGRIAGKLKGVGDVVTVAGRELEVFALRASRSARGGSCRRRGSYDVS